MNHRFNYLWLGLGILVGIIVWGEMPALSAIDLNQHRLDTPLPIAQDRANIYQTFQPSQNGLSEIEILLVRGNEPDSGAEFRLLLSDSDGQTVAQQSWATEGLVHNQSLRLSFPPQANSAGKQYSLILNGSIGNQVSAWGYSLDVLANGELSYSYPNELTAQELRFSTRYQLDGQQLVRRLAEIVGQQGALLALTVLFLAVPGWWVVRWAGFAGWDWGSRAGIALSSGAAIWSLLWLWLTVLGGRWQSWSLWSVLLLLAGAAWLFNRWRPIPPSIIKDRPPAILVVILLLGIGLRLLAVQGLAFPAWVDASRHGLITQLMEQSGQFLGSYEPFLSVERTPYHYGFHALSASLALMTGQEVTTLLLIVGQLLNGLVALTVYAGTFLLTRNRSAALWAAFLVAIPFFFPAYYVTWGRYTQLTAMLLWAPLLALTWQLVRGGKGWYKGWWVIGLESAGIFLIHFRVFLLYLPFVFLLFLISRGRQGRWLLASGSLGALLVLPRLITLYQLNRNARWATSIEAFNTFPTGYVTAGWERWFLIAGGVCLLGAFVAAWRGKQWAFFPLTMGAWSAGTFLLLSGNIPGIPSSWIINLNSSYITLFVPLAMILALSLHQLHRWLKKQPFSFLLPLKNSLLAALLTLLTLFGSQQQLTILNDQTILAHPADKEAIYWLADHLPPQSYIAVNSWKWLGETWTGSDGGAWITPLTGYRTTTPPVDYIYNRELFAQVRTFNEAASQIQDWSAPQAAHWLQQQGVTHLFVGVRGGFFDPATLAGNPALTLLYSQNGTFIFQINSPP